MLCTWGGFFGERTIFMNVYLQIGLGLLPGCLVTLFILIRRRAFNVNKILFTFFLIAICGSFLYGGIGIFINENGIVRTGVSKKRMLEFANALAVNGAYEDSLSVIDQYSEEYGYDDDCRLLTSRIALLEGDYDRATHLYSYLSDNTDIISDTDSEIILAQNKVEEVNTDYAIIDYLNENGEDISEYGFDSEERKSEDDEVEYIKNEIKEIVEENYSISNDVFECAEVVSELSDLNITEYVGSEEESKGHYRRKFSEIEQKDKNLLQLDSVTKARIRALIISGDYDLIVKNLGDGSNYHELMIAAELYMSGLISKKDFSDYYSKGIGDDASALKSKLDDIVKNNQKDMTVQERKNLKKRISALKKQVDEPELMLIKEQLSDAINDKAGADRTKVYLELAKISNYYGNDTLTDLYLSEAIYSSQDNADDSYVAAMANIINVIDNDGDNTEIIKSVSDYVDDVLDHSLTVDVENIIAPRDDYKPNSYDEYEDSDGNEEKDKDTDKTEQKDFKQTTVDYVSRIKSAISIGKIDTEKFEEITAKVQINSDYYSTVSDLKKVLKVYDCGVNIDDYEIKKIDYSNSNIILVCDVSGSMGESIQDLRDAVETFVSDKNGDERISIVTFDDSIVDKIGFGASDAQLVDFAHEMMAGGQTDMFSAVISSLGDFSVNSNDNNVLILMTDGQDNSPKNADRINAEIGGLALSKGVTIYTMGLGTDVDTAYLTTIANSGNGEFIYVSDSSSLTGFYDMLHSQVNSQYEIKYRAKDTYTMSGRTLEVFIPDENIRDIKTYSLGEDNTEGLRANKDISISGISPKNIYKGRQKTNVNLKGTGFKKDDTISVRLKGTINYNPEVTFVDEETYVLEIPANISVGSYDVEVSIGGKRTVLDDGLTVLAQTVDKKTIFGPYEFTSNERIESGDRIILRGMVTMNGWLHFKGDVELIGDLENDGSIRIIDNGGSYVAYDASTAEGIGLFLAKEGISLDILPLGEFNLYNDQLHLYDYSNYRVDDVEISLFVVNKLLALDRPCVRLYPDSVGLYYTTGSSRLPFQDQILNMCDQKIDLFDFSFDGSARVTSKNVGIVLDTEADDTTLGDPFVEQSTASDYKHQLNFLNSPVNFNGKIIVKINTISNEYTLGGLIQLGFFEQGSAVGAEVTWKDNLVPDSVEIGVSLASGIKLSAGIPLELNDFTHKVSNINDAVENGTWTKLMFTGSFSISCMKISEYAPALKPILGDLSFLSMPNTTSSLRVSPLTVELSSELYFLETVKLMENQVRLGTFEYGNSLLSLGPKEVKGLNVRNKTGLMWKSPQGGTSFELSGEIEIIGEGRFVGVQGTGVVDLKVVGLHLADNVSAEAAAGFRNMQNGKQEFVFVYKCHDFDGKIRGKTFTINIESGSCGKNSGVFN